MIIIVMDFTTTKLDSKIIYESVICRSDLKNNWWLQYIQVKIDMSYLNIDHTLTCLNGKGLASLLAANS